MNYYSMNQYCQDTFGKKLYKLSIDAGLSCPNRDGTLGFRGCIFCDGDGAGHFAGNKNISVKEQLLSQKKLINKKLPKNMPYGYIAYFQAFTNTYGPIDHLRELYMEALSDPEVEVISIATRPDCLDDSVINLLMEINRIKPVWVELGLQTIHEKTAEYIRRGYDLSVYDEAIKRLNAINISQIIVHLIIGLPGESKEDIIESVDYVVKSNASGMKLQLLHILRDTDLCKEYEEGKIHILSMEEYIDILAECIKHIPKNIVVHRLTGDGSKANLVAPLWSGDKKRVINEINRRI